MNTKYYVENIHFVGYDISVKIVIENGTTEVDVFRGKSETRDTNRGEREWNMIPVFVMSVISVCYIE